MLLLLTATTHGISIKNAITGGIVGLEVWN